MGQQRTAPHLGAGGRLILVASLLLPFLPSCNRRETPPPPGPSTRPITIASLVPAATDLIVGMGARDRLVAVSTFDAARPDVATLPRVGDYQTTDWETLATLEPTCMVIQMDPAHVPPGMTRRAAAQHTRLLDVRIDRLDDIFTTLDQLGDVLQLERQAADTAVGLRHQLGSVRQMVSGDPPMPALLVVGEGTESVAGRRTFLDDLLSIAGGTNVAAVLGRPWPEIDQEELLSLRPQVVIVLAPGITGPGQAAMSDRWRRLLADRPEERVFLIGAGYALLPGIHVGDLAAQMASCLHTSPLPPGVALPVRVR